MGRERFVVMVFLVACGGAAPSGTAPNAAAKPASDAATSSRADPCSSLPECPAQCPQGVEAVSGRGCGSEGLRCGDDATECKCTDGLWSCAPYDRPKDVGAACTKMCRG
jgi:hypothetical protein